MPRPRTPARAGLPKASAGQNPAAPSLRTTATPKVHSEGGLEHFSTRLPVGMKRALKTLALQTDQPTQALVVASLSRMLADVELWPPAASDDS